MASTLQSAQGEASTNVDCKNRGPAPNLETTDDQNIEAWTMAAKSAQEKQPDNLSPGQPEATSNGHP